MKSVSQTLVYEIYYWKSKKRKKIYTVVMCICIQIGGKFQRIDSTKRLHDQNCPWIKFYGRIIFAKNAICSLISRDIEVFVPKSSHFCEKHRLFAERQITGCTTQSQPPGNRPPTPLCNHQRNNHCTRNKDPQHWLLSTEQTPVQK